MGCRLDRSRDHQARAKVFRMHVPLELPLLDHRYATHDTPMRSWTTVRSPHHPPHRPSMSFLLYKKMSGDPRPKSVATIVGFEASLGRWTCRQCGHINKNVGPRECQSCAWDRYDGPAQVSFYIDYETSASRKLAVWMNPVPKWSSEDRMRGDQYGKRLVHAPADPVPMPQAIAPAPQWKSIYDPHETNPEIAFRAAPIEDMFIGDSFVPPCFDPEVIAKNGALFTRFAAPCNLVNRIHPLFDQARWKNTPPKVYDYLRPALKLASRILVARSLSQFWVTLFEGPRILDLIMEDPAVTPEAWERAQNRLLYYANQTQCLTFHWGESGSLLPFETESVWAACGRIHHSQVAKEYQPEDWKHAKDPGMRLWHGRCLYNVPRHD